MKTTIRENILFGEAYRPRRYEKVLMSCALKEDIRCLPDGDLTEIGTNSLNLSGGQKSRIAIARALYSSANVVIMVNVYSNKNAYVYIQENKLIFCFIFFLFSHHSMVFVIRLHCIDNIQTQNCIIHLQNKTSH